LHGTFGSRTFNYGDSFVFAHPFNGFAFTVVKRRGGLQGLQQGFITGGQGVAFIACILLGGFLCGRRKTLPGRIIQLPAQV